NVLDGGYSRGHGRRGPFGAVTCELGGSARHPTPVILLHRRLDATGSGSPRRSWAAPAGRWSTSAIRRAHANAAERLISKLKAWRGLATRYDTPWELPRRPPPSRLDDLDQGPSADHPLITTR